MTTPENDRPAASASTASALTASAAPRLVPARVDLADYRRRSYEAASDRLRWRYEHGLPTS